MALKEQDVVLYSTDADGNKVIQMPITRVENVEGAIKTIDGVAPYSSGNLVLNTRIPREGLRNVLAGYETAPNTRNTNGTTVTIKETSPDSSIIGQNISISNGTSGTSWVKLVQLAKSNPTITLGSYWSWQGGSVPTIVEGGFLVCCWCGSRGIATFISPS